MTETVKRYAGLDGREYVEHNDYARLEQSFEQMRNLWELQLGRDNTAESGCTAMQSERDAALKQVEGLRLDAERYRLYRHGMENPEALDAGIDAALSAKP